MSLIRRSVTLQGHRTSLALEPEYWAELDAAARDRNLSRNALVAEIDEARTTLLASAIRVWLLNRLKAQQS
ncbi:ribbon-helix-helix domain-containing protein [Sandaracinobacteroides saxicola]|uniref:Ribbon-helix-helix domain-containing protein n=1 Tax=Sandaracinobacteroides saxicola TaxID=2759707 RepID=A0A7G5IED7_9SPHN|nr:ribbon-helix-helix domain-containing protein [Sandaracinobacteroides saxicola]QMW21729.1 ribbon-helix-helix domain-containing protein [Sandaracinobacteroides saxicola]